MGRRWGCSLLPLPESYLMGRHLACRTPISGAAEAGRVGGEEGRRGWAGFSRPRASADIAIIIYTGRNGLPLLSFRDKRGNRVESFAHNSSTSMPRPDWSADECAQLWRAVSVHGRNWGDIVGGPLAIPGRSASSMRQRWYLMCNQGDIPAPLPPLISSTKPLLATSGPSPSVLPLPLDCVLLPPRSVYSGRPWDYVVQRVSVEEKADHVRLPTERQARYVRNWNLGCARGRGLLLCNMKRAEVKLRSYYTKLGPWWASVEELMWSCPISVSLRDELGMVLYPGQGGATVTRTCASLNWVGGQSAGLGRFVTATEVAAFMGISSRPGGVCDVARRYYSDCLLCGLLAESVHSRVADFGAAVGRSQLTSKILSIGSLYSGAFDELGTACARAFEGACRSFVAELDPRKTRVLWESHGPYRCYESVEAVDGEYPADCLVASPPCLVFSKANRLSTLADKEDAADSQVGQIRRVVELLAPRLVILEQTDGLRTHCPTAYEKFKNLWSGLPYRVYHSTVDARDTCGGSHHRARLIWVAILEGGF